MKLSTFFSLFALVVSLAAAAVALVSYFGCRCAFCDDIEDDLMEYSGEDEDEADAAEPAQSEADDDDCCCTDCSGGEDCDANRYHTGE